MLNAKNRKHKYMELEESLKTGFISIRKLASKLYPDKQIATATATLHNKIKKVNGNRLNDDEQAEIKKILKKLFGNILK